MSCLLIPLEVTTDLLDGFDFVLNLLNSKRKVKPKIV